MISTLKDVIAPLTEVELLRHFRERTVAFVRASQSSRFETLLDWDELNCLLEGGLYPIEDLRVRESLPIPTSFYTDGGRLDHVVFSSLMDRGADLIFNRLDRYVPRLRRLCQELAERTGEQVTAEAIVTSGKEDARQHVNTEDICVLQIAGSKRWELWDTPGASPLDNISERPASQSAPFFDEVLCSGDLLFVPSKFWYRCENGPGRSLHVCIVSEAPHGRDVVTWLTNRLTADETFNGPLTRYADARTLAAHEAALKARLIEEVQAWSLTDFLAERAAARSKKVVIRIQGTQEHSSEPWRDSP